MPKLPDCALVRSYVLNNLEEGPVRVVDLMRRGKDEFGFSHTEILAAAEHFGVVTRVHKGKIYWSLPANPLWHLVGLQPRPRSLTERYAAGLRRAASPAGKFFVPMTPNWSRPARI